MSARPEDLHAGAGYGREPVDDTALPPSRERMERVLGALRGVATLSEVLRILGAMVMLASLSVFLLQGWHEGNDVSRYLMLLTQTGLLTAAGFTLAYGLKENKGARMFFGLALISVAANFTILGALVYSVVQWDAGLVHYPDYASWQLVGAGGAAVTLAGALLALVPVTLLGFAIMARRSFKPLAVHFLVLNALLLLPLRGSLAVGTLALAATLYALWQTRRLGRRDTTLATREGRFALTTLFLPVVILVFRSMYFYAVDSLMVAMLATVAFVLLRQFALAPERDRRLRSFVEIVSMILALVVAATLTDGLQPVLADVWLLPAFAAAFCLLCGDVGRRAGTQALSRMAYGFAALMLALCFLYNAAAFPGLITAGVCALLGACLALAGHGGRDGVALFAGYAMGLGGAVLGFGELVALFRRADWVDLALLGGGAIAVGSLLDRHGAALRLRAERWLGRARGDA